jgi:PAS domain S-box-containing protein
VATLKEERRGGGAGRVYGQGDAALILVVEDNADMNDFIASSLEGSYRVAQAFDGRQGVAKALALGPEAIVTDVMMPDLGGEDLIRELRSHRDLDAVPIIVLSALVDDALRVRLLREGAQDYLGKPFSEAELHARIERLLAERRRSAEALKEAEDRYRLVAENAVDVIWILDPAVWRFRFVSPSVERLRGWTAEEVLGQELEAALVPASAARLKAAMPGRITAFLDGGASTYVDEIEQPRKGGGTVWTETTTRFVPGAKTGAVEIYGISRDISERRQAEARMRRDLAEREALIRELYHRTRNNMSVISSMLDLQALRMEDEAATASFEAIARKIDAMALAHRMLYGAGDLSHVKLDDYIRELAGLFLAHAPLEAERIDLVLELAPASCLLDLAIPFGQVLSELILNSLRHAFPDGREGRISLGLSSLPDGRLDFRYADDGVGLPQGFDPRLAGGLGLETLFMLVEHQLQGSVEVETRGGLFWRIVFGGTAYKVRV